MATYFVQIVNKPCQIVILKARHTLLVLFPIEDVTKFILEPRRRPVEAMELL